MNLIIVKSNIYSQTKSKIPLIASSKDEALKIYMEGTISAWDASQQQLECVRPPCEGFHQLSSVLPAVVPEQDEFGTPLLLEGVSSCVHLRCIRKYFARREE